MLTLEVMFGLNGDIARRYFAAVEELALYERDWLD
jgi:hypothetical protein